MNPTTPTDEELNEEARQHGGLVLTREHGEIVGKIIDPYPPKEGERMPGVNDHKWKRRKLKEQENTVRTWYAHSQGSKERRARGNDLRDRR